MATTTPPIPRALLTPRIYPDADIQISPNNNLIEHIRLAIPYAFSTIYERQCSSIDIHPNGERLALSGPASICICSTASFHDTFSHINPHHAVFTEEIVVQSGVTINRFSPCGTFLAAGSVDGTVTIYHQTSISSQYKDLRDTVLSRYAHFSTQAAQNPHNNPQNAREPPMSVSSFLQKHLAQLQLSSQQSTNGFSDAIDLSKTQEGALLEHWVKCYMVTHNANSSVLDLSWSPDSSRLVVSGSDQCITVWSIPQPTLDPLTGLILSLNTFDLPQLLLTPHHAMMTPSGYSHGMGTVSASTILGTKGNPELISRLGTSDNLNNTNSHTAMVHGVAFDPLGVYIASQDLHGNVIIWRHKEVQGQDGTMKETYQFFKHLHSSRYYNINGELIANAQSQLNAMTRGELSGQGNKNQKRTNSINDLRKLMKVKELPCSRLHWAPDGSTLYVVGGRNIVYDKLYQITTSLGLDATLHQCAISLEFQRDSFKMLNQFINGHSLTTIVRANPQLFSPQPLPSISLSPEAKKSTSHPTTQVAVYNNVTHTIELQQQFTTALLPHQNLYSVEHSMYPPPIGDSSQPSLLIRGHGDLPFYSIFATGSVDGTVTVWAKHFPEPLLIIPVLNEVIFTSSEQKNKFMEQSKLIRSAVFNLGLDSINGPLGFGELSEEEPSTVKDTVSSKLSKSRNKQKIVPVNDTMNDGDVMTSSIPKRRSGSIKNPLPTTQTPAPTLSVSTTPTFASPPSDNLFPTPYTSLTNSPTSRLARNTSFQAHHTHFFDMDSDALFSSDDEGSDKKSKKGKSGQKRFFLDESDDSELFDTDLLSLQAHNTNKLASSSGIARSQALLQQKTATQPSFLRKSSLSIKSPRKRIQNNDPQHIMGDSDDDIHGSIGMKEATPHSGLNPKLQTKSSLSLQSKQTHTPLTVKKKVSPENLTQSQTRNSLNKKNMDHDDDGEQLPQKGRKIARKTDKNTKPSTETLNNTKVAENGSKVEKHIQNKNKGDDFIVSSSESENDADIQRRNALGSQFGDMENADMCTLPQTLDDDKTSANEKQSSKNAKNTKKIKATKDTGKGKTTKKSQIPKNIKSDKDAKNGNTTKIKTTKKTKTQTSKNTQSVENTQNSAAQNPQPARAKRKTASNTQQKTFTGDYGDELKAPYVNKTVIDLAWSSDGHTLYVCYHNGAILTVRFGIDDLGYIVPDHIVSEQIAKRNITVTNKSKFHQDFRGINANNRNITFTSTIAKVTNSTPQNDQHISHYTQPSLFPNPAHSTLNYTTAYPSYLAVSEGGIVGTNVGNTVNSFMHHYMLDHINSDRQKDCFEDPGFNRDAFAQKIITQPLPQLQQYIDQLKLSKYRKKSKHGETTKDDILTKKYLPQLQNQQNRNEIKMHDDISMISPENSHSTAPLIIPESLQIAIQHITDPVFDSCSEYSSSDSDEHSQEDDPATSSESDSSSDSDYSDDEGVFNYNTIKQNCINQMLLLSYLKNILHLVHHTFHHLYRKSSSLTRHPPTDASNDIININDLINARHDRRGISIAITMRTMTQRFWEDVKEEFFNIYQDAKDTLNFEKKQGKMGEFNDDSSDTDDEVIFKIGQPALDTKQNANPLKFRNVDDIPDDFIQTPQNKALLSKFIQFYGRYTIHEEDPALLGESVTNIVQVKRKNAPNHLISGLTASDNNSNTISSEMLASNKPVTAKSTHTTSVLSQEQINSIMSLMSQIVNNNASNNVANDTTNTTTTTLNSTDKEREPVNTINTLDALYHSLQNITTASFITKSDSQLFQFLNDAPSTMKLEMLSLLNIYINNTTPNSNMATNVTKFDLSNSSSFDMMMEMLSDDNTTKIANVVDQYENKGIVIDKQTFNLPHNVVSSTTLSANNLQIYSLMNTKTIFTQFQQRVHANKHHSHSLIIDMFNYNIPKNYRPASDTFTPNTHSSLHNPQYPTSAITFSLPTTSKSLANQPLATQTILYNVIYTQTFNACITSHAIINNYFILTLSFHYPSTSSNSQDTAIHVLWWIDLVSLVPSAFHLLPTLPSRLIPLINHETTLQQSQETIPTTTATTMIDDSPLPTKISNHAPPRMCIIFTNGLLWFIDFAPTLHTMTFPFSPFNSHSSPLFHDNTNNHATSHYLYQTTLPPPLSQLDPSLSQTSVEYNSQQNKLLLLSPLYGVFSISPQLHRDNSCSTQTVSYLPKVQPHLINNIFNHITTRTILNQINKNNNIMNTILTANHPDQTFLLCDYLLFLISSTNKQDPSDSTIPITIITRPNINLASLPFTFTPTTVISIATRILDVIITANNTFKMQPPKDDSNDTTSTTETTQKTVLFNPYYSNYIIAMLQNLFVMYKNYLLLLEQHHDSLSIPTSSTLSNSPTTVNAISKPYYLYHQFPAFFNKFLFFIVYSFKTLETPVILASLFQQNPNSITGTSQHTTTNAVQCCGFKLTTQNDLNITSMVYNYINLLHSSTLTYVNELLANLQCILTQKQYEHTPTESVPGTTNILLYYNANASHHLINGLNNQQKVNIDVLQHKQQITNIILSGVSFIINSIVSMNSFISKLNHILNPIDDNARHKTLGIDAHVGSQNKILALLALRSNCRTQQQVMPTEIIPTNTIATFTNCDDPDSKTNEFIKMTHHNIIYNLVAPHITTYQFYFHLFLDILSNYCFQFFDVFTVIEYNFILNQIVNLMVIHQNYSTAILPLDVSEIKRMIVTEKPKYNQSNPSQLTTVKQATIPPAASDSNGFGFDFGLHNASQQATIFSPTSTTPAQTTAVVAATPSQITTLAVKRRIAPISIQQNPAQ